MELAKHFKNDEYIRSIKIHNNFTEKGNPEININNIFMLSYNLHIVNNDIPQLQSEQKENHDVFANLIERYSQLHQVITIDLQQFEREKNDLQIELSNKRKQMEKKTIIR